VVLSNRGRSESFLWRPPITRGYPSGSLKPGDKREVSCRRQPITRGYPSASVQAAQRSRVLSHQGISERFRQTFPKHLEAYMTAPVGRPHLTCWKASQISKPKIRHQIHLEVVLQTIFFVANFKWFSETRGYVSVLVPEVKCWFGLGFAPGSGGSGHTFTYTQVPAPAQNSICWLAPKPFVVTRLAHSADLMCARQTVLTAEC